MIRISVIIPVYNAAKTLPRCIDSVFSQTLAPYEVITINDGSTDSSLTILNSYAKQHPQLQIITQENSGVSAARNTGIYSATGDWMMFLDADDYLAHTTLETLSRNTKGEIALAGLTIHTSNKIHNQNLYQKNVNKNTEGILDAYEALSILNYYTFCGPICKLFRTDIVKHNKLLFPTDMRFGEDTIFVYTYLKYVKHIAVHNAHLYHCNKSNEYSLTATVNSATRYYSINRIYPIMKDVYQFHHLSLEYVDYIYMDALQTAAHLSYIDHSITTAERIRIYQSMFSNEHFDIFKPQCSPVFITLGKMHAWHLCDLYLKSRTF